MHRNVKKINCFFLTKQIPLCFLGGFFLFLLLDCHVSVNIPHPKKIVLQGIQEGLELFLAKKSEFILRLSLIKENCTIDQIQNCPYIALLQFLFRIHVSNVNVCKLLTNSVIAPINMRQTNCFLMISISP